MCVVGQALTQEVTCVEDAFAMWTPGLAVDKKYQKLAKMFVPGAMGYRSTPA